MITHIEFIWIPSRRTVSLIERPEGMAKQPARIE
jgi:hypothetical protein